MDTSKKRYRSVTLRIGFALLFEFLLTRMLNFRGAKILYGITGSQPTDVEVGILNCFLYLLCFMLPVFFFRLLSIGKEQESMGLGVKVTKDSVLLIPIGIAAISACGIITSLLFSWVDFSVLYGETDVSSGPMIVLDFVSTAIVPAICEEFLFRGCILSNLKPFGKQQAIFASAIAFALMHGNFPQFLYTFVCGVILGYCYVETGSVWMCMLIHLFNNFLSTADSVLQSGADEYWRPAIAYSMHAVCLIAGVLCLVIFILRKNGKPLKPSDNERENTSRYGLGDFLKSPTVIIFGILGIIRATYYLIYALYH